jgi:hypothetical protein
MASTYYKCDAPVTKNLNGCVMVDEPVYSLFTVKEAEELFVAFAALLVTIAVFRALSRIF